MGGNRAHRPPPDRAAALDAAIAGLRDCYVEQLRLQWRNHLGGAAPAHLPRWLLLRLLAHRLQVAALGDLDKTTLRALRLPKRDGDGASDCRPFETRGPTTREGIGLQPGSLLVREWNGKPERVMILEKGFAWNGATYRSLSQIAKAMTGASWNGHRFFGLRPAKGQGVAPKGNRSSGDNRSHNAAAAAPGNDRTARPISAAAPSTPASRPNMAWSRSSTRWTISARPRRPISRARRTKAGS
jgi:hypothetical protein